MGWVRARTVSTVFLLTRTSAITKQALIIQIVFCRLVVFFCNIVRGTAGIYLHGVDLVAQKLHVLHDNVDETFDDHLLHEVRVVLPVGRDRVDLEHLLGLAAAEGREREGAEEGKQ